MTISKTVAVVALLVLGIEAASADSALRGREPRAGAQTSASQVKELAPFCIADDRCSAIAPRPVAELARYAAKMDAAVR